MRILNQIEKKELLQLNQKKDIEASYGKKISKLNITEEKKTNIKKENTKNNQYK